MIEYNNGVDMTVSSATIQKVFPPFDLSNVQKNVHRTIVGVNTELDNLNKNIIGPI